MSSGASMLLITRKYPPAIGGMETYWYQLWSRLERGRVLARISLGRSQRHLWWFLPWSVAATTWLCWSRKIPRVHIGDVLLAPLGLLVAGLTGARLSITAFGLDVIYPNPLYQAIVRLCLPRYSKVVCISRATREACVERGVPPSACTVIPCGVAPQEVCRRHSRPEARQLLYEQSGLNLEGKTVVITVGRLVRRKGVSWFLEEVLPTLPDDVLYLIVGNGPEENRIRELVGRGSLQGRAIALGGVPTEVRELLYDAADVFAMPNRQVPGDIEGFGLVALEAGMHGLPVVASAIEGIRDSVVGGETGILVAEQDAQAFARAILQARSWRDEALPDLVAARSDWKIVAQAFARAVELS